VFDDAYYSKVLTMPKIKSVYYCKMKKDYMVKFLPSGKGDFLNFDGMFTML